MTVPTNSRISTPLSIVVMGVSGTGKSTVGAALASAIGAPFLEGDSFHTPEAIAKMRAGVPLTDQDRWPWLDRIGNGVEAALLDRGRAVTACSALRRAYRDRLRARITAPVRFALLSAKREALLCRISERPNHYMPSSLLSSQLDTLELPQPDEQAITLDAELSSATLCAQIIAWLERGLPG